MTVIEPFWKQPSHPGILAVEVNPGSFTSRAISSRAFAPNEVVTKITGYTKAQNVAYSTVQVSATEHIELNSDLLYCNHSCDPNVVFDVSKYEVRAIKHIAVGDAITFFYPSSEWEMAQSFNCTCGSSSCLGLISGAKDLDAKTVQKYWFNQHIRQLLAQVPKP
ncbi:hypothetical protein AWJ20_3621 [Sugiyamaella lignohabitans]|uniref:Post-SET domain-containing protein n=1 Tax=Sugiyamaella lignohabitans TaxID=796027 RepID=A0A170QYB6_9ASCO|nr:uncharacterized protein AWJ20_3621 [Sugiyamaella lignohabitans]ANB15972.1 hypothetical protein AWJ20_3621 [Sugiyamaella lignohabitans]